MVTILITIVAGLLTSFSPCVISALPFVVGSALSKNRFGPLLITGGLIASFVLLGVVFSLTTQVAGLNQTVLRNGAAVLFVIIGLVFVIPKLSQKLTLLLSPVANKSSGLAARQDSQSGFSLFLLGFLFGFIWSPCSGPTLGFALTLVAKQGEILYGSFIMLVFGVSASLPLLMIAYFSRNFFQRNMATVDRVYHYAKYAMGGFLILIGVATLTNYDRAFEAFLIRAMPEGWIELITRY